MKRLSIIVGFLGLLTCSDASGHEEDQSQSPSNVAGQTVSNWTVNKAKSSLAFSGVQSGEAFTGSFSDFETVINFDPDNLAAATVVVTIDMNSVEADDIETANALPGKEWFYIRKFPVAKFEASDFKHVSEDKYEANGNLSIKGITQSINLPFSLKIENGTARMDAVLNINRTRYKVGTGMWASKEWVEHNIAVNVHLEARQSK